MSEPNERAKRVRRENRVEYLGGRWVVSGHGGCPHCRAEFTMSLDLPESFLLQMIEEGRRREREEGKR